MTDIEERFLKAYSLALQGDDIPVRRETQPEDWMKNMSAADWARLFSLAESHRVFPAVFEAVYPAAVISDMNRSFFQNRLKTAAEETCGQARMTAEFLKLYQFLRKRGLSPIVIKGIICRSLYPNPEQRSSSDEDLLIKDEEFPKYHKAFLDYGLHVASPGVDTEKDYEVSYCSSRVYIELHKSPFPPESKAYGDLNRFFEDVDRRSITEAIYGVPLRTLGCTDHLFYQICHAYKHFLNCGIGIRLVSDIVLYSRANLERIDWESIAARCREIHAYDFTAALYRIGMKYLFPEVFPERLSRIWESNGEDESDLLEDILKGGIYGTSSEERLHSSNFTLHAAENARTGRRSSAIFHTLLPGFESMKRRYPLLNRLPFLLPAAWIRRIAGYAAARIRNRRGRKQVTEAVRIGNERVALMRRYRLIENRQKEQNPLKRLYKWSHSSFLAPVLSPLYEAISMAEYCLLNLKWFLQGDRLPSEQQKTLVRENVTFIIKSFERQRLVKGLCRNISWMYPGTRIIVADDSRNPLKISRPNVKVIRLPFNSGLSAGLHEALKEVTTPFTARLDDDELLTVRTWLHREASYLKEHPELDLIGFGHTTAIRLHSPEFNFREYYKTPMKDALRPLKIPHRTKLDEDHIVLGKVANIYLVRTEKLRDVGYDPNIRIIDHHDFFWRAAGVIASAAALDTVVFHRHNPYKRAYNAYRSDYAEDLKYIKKKQNRLIREAKRKNEKEDA